MQPLRCRTSSRTASATPWRNWEATFARRRQGRVTQGAREVRTKASKTAVTYFSPVGDDIREVVEGWLNFLVREPQWGLNDPLFPATRVRIGKSGGFTPAGRDRRC